MAKFSKIIPQKHSVKPFPVVGIGASAGGLDAYKRLLKTIPENSGMAYILVQHLDPSHESMLPDILSKHTSIPVHEVTNNIHLVPDHIYIIPANKMLLAADGVLKLSPRPSKEIKNLPIDLLFKSLANVYQNQAVGIVFSGTGSDGTLGLKAIKEAGGITFAQDQQSAAYDGMPQSAIDAGVVDFVLAPEKIPEHLLEMNLPKIIQQDELVEADHPSEEEDDIFAQIISLLRLRREMDFAYYKKNTLKRRIARRMAINKMAQGSAYLDFLKNNKNELDLLFQDLLIPVTSFFRDTAAFEALKDKVYPEIIKGKSGTQAIRIWTAACSTGEEAYSIAISLCEFLGDRTSRIKIQIFGTDISGKAISFARLGTYTKQQLEGVSDSRLQQFFTRLDGQYQVNKTVRDMVVFASHNMLKDPPFAKMDLISCRNVLIYMESFLQKKALTTFHYSLNDNGFLMLGKSETTGSQSEYFNAIDKHEKIFLKKEMTGRFKQRAAERKEPSFKEADKTVVKAENLRTDFQKTADDILLQEYTPAGVVIDEQSDIVHFRGDTGTYLTPAPGKPSLNLFKMAREGLGFELRSALHKAKTGNSPVTKEGVLMRINEAEKLVTIKVIPLPKTIEPYYLVLFQESLQQETANKKKGTENKKQETDIRIQQLERELLQAREDMRTITEEQEAVTEELQSANEELLSGSEELQSLNEELETSKEELQSGNEELTIVNQELFERNEIITDARKYSDTIIATIREPLLVLNKDMQIRTANRSFYKTFHVNEKETEGKLLYELGNHQWDIPALRNLLQNMLPGKKEIADFEMTQVFPVIGERTMLLNAAEIQRESDKEKLILLAIEDITERKNAEQQLMESEARSDKERMVLYNSFMNAPAAIAIVKGPTHIYEFSNSDYEELTGRKITIGKTARELFPEIEQQGLTYLLDDTFATGKPFIANEFPVELNTKGDGILEKFTLNFVVQPLKDEKGNTERLLIHIIDVTQQVKARKQIEASEKRFSNILSQSIMAICIFKGPEMTVAFANEPLLATWGRGKEVIGKPLLEFMPEIKDQTYPKLLAEVYITGVPYYGYESKVMLVRKGKLEEVYYNLVYQPYREVDDTITGVTVIAAEVTEQVLAKKQMDENADRYRFLADAVPEKVWTTDENGGVNYFNQQWVYYTGLSFEELNDWNWEKIIHPDDLEAHQNLWKHSINSGEDFQLEHRFLRHDGEYRWHLSRSLAQKDEKGKTIMWVGTITDIHEQKILSEEKILFEFAEDFASYKTGEEFFSSLVTYLAKKTGMDYVFIGELVKEDEKHSHIKTKALSAHGKIVANIEYALPDGPCEQVISATVYSFPQDCMISFPKNKTITQFNVEGYVGYPLSDTDGNAIGLVAVMHEKEIPNHEYVSALLKIIAKRAEFEMERIKFSEVLRENNMHLEISNRNLAQYAYIASHDLQEPLRKILTFSSLMTERSKGVMDEVIKSNLEKITKSASRMKQLIQDLLTFSSVEKKGDIFIKTDLNEVLQNVTTDFELLLKEKAAIIESEVLPVIEAVPLQMNQLFYNLVSNSLKFSKPGIQPVISISYKTLAPGAADNHAKLDGTLSYCEIIFKDNGIGFSQEYAEKVFVIFQRLNDLQQFAGTGIGLALCRKIAEYHSGEMYVEAKENEGAAFHIILPLEQGK